jgi:hypothetical protein
MTLSDIRDLPSPNEAPAEKGETQGSSPTAARKRSEDVADQNGMDEKYQPSVN